MKWSAAGLNSWIAQKPGWWVCLYLRPEGWQLATYRRRTLVERVSLGRMEPGAAQQAANEHLQWETPADPYAFTPGTCASCGEETKVLAFHGNCEPCLSAPPKPPPGMTWENQATSANVGSREYARFRRRATKRA